MNSKLFFLMMIAGVGGVGCTDSGKRAADLTKDFEDSVTHVAFTTPIQLNLAKEYIGNFTDSPGTKPIRDAMGGDIVKSFSFDRSVMARFVDQFNQGNIDGFRLYMAKYDNNANDAQAFDKKNFTVILVGTKFNTAINDYKDTLVPVPSSSLYYLTLEDYSNPCKPPCPGAILPAMTKP